MKKKTTLWLSLSIVMMLAIILVSACSPGKGGGSPNVSQCTDYVWAKLSLSGDFGKYPDAKDWHDYLVKENPFHQVNDPSTGAIVVFQPSFSKTGIDQKSGHVGIVQSAVTVTVNGVQDWQILVRGANQINPETGLIGTENEAGCTDVNTLSYLPYPKSRGGIEYFIRN